MVFVSPSPSKKRTIHWLALGYRICLILKTVSPNNSSRRIMGWSLLLRKILCAIIMYVASTPSNLYSSFQSKNKSRNPHPAHMGLYRKQQNWWMGLAWLALIKKDACLLNPLGKTSQVIWENWMLILSFYGSLEDGLHINEDTLKLLEYTSTCLQEEKALYQQASYKTFLKRRLVPFRWLDTNWLCSLFSLAKTTCGRVYGKWPRQSHPLQRKNRGLDIDLPLDIGFAQYSRQCHPTAHLGT